MKLNPRGGEKRHPPDHHLSVNRPIRKIPPPAKPYGQRVLSWLSYLHLHLTFVNWMWRLINKEWKVGNGEAKVN